MAYEFEDAQATHKANPGTFDIPKVRTLAALKKGDYVKVSHSGERFWVKLVEITKMELTGYVSNDLIRDHPFKYGSLVTFNRRQVYNVLKEKLMTKVAVGTEVGNIRKLCPTCNKTGLR